MYSWLAYRYIEPSSLLAVGCPIATESQYRYGKLACLSRLRTLSLWAVCWPIAIEIPYCYGQLACPSLLRDLIASGSWLACLD
ncbi:hypothetical protein DPMN_020457 [Dreissena polymorpha]|uniref:Uncharacterized protein n=1 Tax=Dreissena polymorpha TaxID=45954 RepID=A0A9D4SB24_DREPO|nr:hypothetical protein DPMN_020457 [Dreissena polymorpha]